MASGNPFSLESKRALVAGASRGIGLAIAHGLARAGAHTVLAARSLPLLEQHAAGLRAEGMRAEALALDVADPESVRAAVEAAGEIDALHCVAGMNIRKPFLDYTQEEYERIMNVNLHGIARLVKQAAPGMIARGRGGKIVLIGSLMSVVGLPHLTVYAMTKSGLAGLTRTLAAEWGRHNIQVNCIAPGFIVTDLNREVWQREELRAWLRGRQPNPNPGVPEDIAPLAVFLSGRGSDYVTGQVIAVDGGYSTTSLWPYEPGR